MTEQAYAPADFGSPVAGQVPEPVRNKYAVSEAWQKGKEFKKPFDYTLAGSGQTVLLHRVDMGDILKLGVADELDFMSKALISADVKPGEDQNAAEAVANVVKKSQNFAQMEKMINAVVSVGVIQPKLYEIPLHENARQAGLMYIDEIPWEDRMELFGVIFESEGLSTFREEQEAGVGNVEHVTSVQLPPDGPVDIRPDDS